MNISRLLQREILLLHIVAKEKNADPSLRKLSQQAEKLQAKSGLTTKAIVRAGNIFETIREVASENHAELVIMGTHGRKGTQKLWGSWALKVMAHSKIPFLVVQDMPQKDNFEKVVFPIDFRRENKEKVNWMHYLSKLFKPRFLLFKRKVSDRGFKKWTASNLHYAESFLKNNDVPYELKTSSGKRSFEKETVRFAKEKEADLILVLVTRDIGFFDYLLAAREQYIISNPEKIPVMCINPRPSKISSGFRAAGG